MTKIWYTTKNSTAQQQNRRKKIISIIESVSSSPQRGKRERKNKTEKFVKPRCVIEFRRSDRARSKKRGCLERKKDWLPVRVVNLQHGVRSVVRLFSFFFVILLLFPEWHLWLVKEDVLSFVPVRSVWWIWQMLAARMWAKWGVKAKINTFCDIVERGEILWVFKEK